MSTKSSVFYGRLGHLYLDQGECSYYWQTRLFRLQMPFSFIWRWMNRVRYSRLMAKAAQRQT